jgi:hypothetical protein
MYLLLRLALQLALAFFLVVTVFGALRFLLEIGVSPTRYVVQDVAVTAAGLMGLAFSWKFSRRLAARKQAADASLDGFNGRRFEAKARVWLQALSLLMLLALSAGLVALLIQKPDWMIGALTALMILVTLFMCTASLWMFRGGPTLAMDLRGLEHALYGLIPWDRVHGLFLKEMKLRHYTVRTLVLGVADPERYRERLPGIQRWLQKTFKPFAARNDVLEIPLNGLDQPASRIHAAAMVLRQKVQPPVIAHWYPGMPKADIDFARDMDRLTREMPNLPPDQVLERLKAMEPKMRSAQERSLNAARQTRWQAWLVVGLAVLTVLATVLAAVMRNA